MTPKLLVKDPEIFEPEELDFKFDEELAAMGKTKDYKEWYFSSIITRTLF